GNMPRPAWFMLFLRGLGNCSCIALPPASVQVVRAFVVNCFLQCAKKLCNYSPPPLKKGD
ncbi:MAG: hypothetical protein QX203_14325, partial [Methylococcaceae bacterium]